MSKLKYFECVLNESGIDDAECRRKMVRKPIFDLYPYPRVQIPGRRGRVDPARPRGKRRKNRGKERLKWNSRKESGESEKVMTNFIIIIMYADFLRDKEKECQAYIRTGEMGNG